MDVEFHIQLDRHRIEGRMLTGDPSQKREITVQEITDRPAALVLEDDEAVIASGLEVTTHGLNFSSPVKVTMKHCAAFKTPGDAQIVLYSRSNGMRYRTEISLLS